MDSQSKLSSRRGFLKRGAALCSLAAAAAARPADGQEVPMYRQIGHGTRHPGYVPEELVPKENIVKDPWTGEPLRDSEGNLVVDWTGSPQWEAYRKTARAIGGPRHGAREKDWRLYGYRSRYVTTYRSKADQASGMPTTVKTPVHLLSPLEDQLGIITPSGLHFMDNHGQELTPDIDPRQHVLRIYGMVDRPVTLTVEELMKRMPSVSRVHSVECNSTGQLTYPGRLAPWARPSDIYGTYSCSEWTGVLLSTLLEAAGVRKGASWVWVGATDFGSNDTVSIPLAKALDDCMICYGQNGEPVRPENGFPLRFLAPGYEGMRNIKRVGRIKVMNEPGLFMRETGTGYTDVRPDQKVRWFRFEMPVKSIILLPSSGQQLNARGYYEMRGLAWSGGGKVRRVEITTDGGRTWKDAQIQEPVFSKAATRWVLPWSWNGEELTIASRATDERGSTQPTAAEWARLTGVSVDYLKEAPPRNWRFNVIQPWKIDRGGKVTNAILAI